MSFLEDAWAAANTAIDATINANTTAASGIWDYALNPAWQATGGRVYDATLGTWGQAQEQDYNSPLEIAWAQAQQRLQEQQLAQEAQRASARAPIETLRPLTREEQYRQAVYNYETHGTAPSPAIQAYALERQTQEPVVTEGELQAAQMQEEQLVQDLDTVFTEQRDEGAIEDWRNTARTLVAVLETAKDEGNAEDMALIQERLAEYQQDIQPHIELLFPGWWEQNFRFDPGSSAFERGAARAGQEALGIAAPILNQVDRASQHVLKAIATGNELRSEDPAVAGIVAGFQLVTGINPYDDDKFDTDGSGSLNFREALGLESDAGGTLGSIADFVGVALTDPWTWASFGTGAKIRASLRGTALVARRLGPEAALRHQTIWTKILGKEGVKGLTPDERIFHEMLIRELSQSAAQQSYSGLSGKARLAVAKQLNRNQDQVARLGEKMAERTIRQVERGGQSGVKFAGRTVLPFNNPVTRGLGLMDTPRYASQVGRLIPDGTETVGRWDPTVRWEEQTGTRTYEEPTYGTRWQAQPESVVFEDVEDVIEDLPWRGTGYAPEAATDPAVQRFNAYRYPDQDSDEVYRELFDHHRYQEEIMSEMGRQVKAGLDDDPWAWHWFNPDNGDVLVWAPDSPKASSYWTHWTREGDLSEAYHPRIRNVNDDGEMFERPVRYVYRTMSVEEWEDALTSGSIKARGRGSEAGGTFAGLNPDTSFDYLADGKIMVRIRVEPEDGWAARVNPLVRDDPERVAPPYPELATTQAIPLDRVEAISQVYKEGRKDVFVEGFDGKPVPREVYKSGLTNIPERLRLRPAKRLGTSQRTVPTPGTRRVERTEPWQEVPTDADPRIDRLRAKAASTPFEAEAESFARKADELADRLNPNQGPNAVRTNLRWSEETVQTGVREVVEEFTERIARNEWRWVEEVIPRMKPSAFDVIVDNTPGLLRRLVQSESGFAGSIRRSLIPRASINARVGAAASDAFVAAQREAQGISIRATDEINARLKGKLGKNAIKEFKGDREQAYRYINAALSDGNTFAKAITESGPHMQDLLTAVNDVREQVWEMLTPAQQALFGSKDSYIPRIVADDAMDWVKDLTPQQIQDLRRATQVNGSSPLADVIEAMRDGGGSTNQVRQAFDDRFLNARTISPATQDLFAVNQEIKDLFKLAGINNVGDLYETDVLVAWSTRATSAFKSRIEGDMLDGLRNMVDENGDRLIMSAAERADARTTKFARIDVMVGEEKLSMHKDIAAAWEEVHQKLLDPLKLEEISKLWDEVNGIWARYALLSPGYHSRNAISNFIMAFLGGLTNPVRYIDAANLQWLRSRAYRLMGKEGLSFDEAFARIKGIKVGASPDPALRRRVLSAELGKNADYVTIKSLEEQRIMSGLVEDIFLGHDDAKPGEAIRDIRKRSKYNITHASRMLGSAIEHNSRTALYLDAIAKGMAPQAAASHVRQYLLDYEDLTRFEQGIRANVSRFYTWMRKNTALQIMTLAKTPGKIINAERIIDELETIIFGEVDAAGENPAMPVWAQVAGMQWRGGNAVGFETPFYSAANTVEDLLALPTIAYDELANVTGLPPISGPLADAIAFNTISDRWGQVLALTSGLPASIITFIVEERTGYDSFIGAPLDPNESFLRLVDTVNPLVGRIDGVRKKIDKVEAGENTAGLLAANLIGGFQVYTGAQAENAARWTLSLEMEKFAEENDLYTIEELQDLGRVEITNRFMYTMAYGGMVREKGQAPAFDPVKFQQELAGYVPQEILDLYPQFRDIEKRYPSMPLPDDELAAAQTRLREADAALAKLLGRPLSQREKVNLIMASEMAPYMEEMEMYGVEPLRNYSEPENNVFLDDLEPQPERPDTIERFDQLGQALGLNFNDIQALSPLISDAERLVQQALATGVPLEQARIMAAEEYLANISQTDTMALFGPDAIADFGWMGMDDKDLAYEQNRGWQDAQALRLLSQALGLGLTEDDIMRTVIHQNMGQTDQRTLAERGLLDQVMPYPPSRENVQTEQEQMRDAIRQLEALQQGTFQGPFLGEYPEEDPRNSWNGWEDGRQTWGD